MSVLYQNGKFINTIGGKLRQLENKINNAGSSTSVQNHGISDTTFALTPNTLHKWDEVTELTLTLGNETPGIVNEYLIQFTSGATPTVLTLPEDIKWASKLTIKADTVYQISIVDNLAVFAEFSNSNVPTFILDLNEIPFEGEYDDIIIDFNYIDIPDGLISLSDYLSNNISPGEDIDNYLIDLGFGHMVDELGLNTIPGITSSSPLITVTFPPEAELDPINFDTVVFSYVEYVDDVYIFLNSRGMMFFSDVNNFIELMPY